MPVTRAEAEAKAEAQGAEANMQTTSGDTTENLQLLPLQLLPSVQIKVPVVVKPIELEGIHHTLVTLFPCLSISLVISLTPVALITLPLKFPFGLTLTNGQTLDLH